MAGGNNSGKRGNRVQWHVRFHAGEPEAKHCRIRGSDLGPCTDFSRERGKIEVPGTGMHDSREVPVTGGFQCPEISPTIFSFQESLEKICLTPGKKNPSIHLMVLPEKFGSVRIFIFVTTRIFLARGFIDRKNFRIMNNTRDKDRFPEFRPG